MLPPPAAINDAIGLLAALKDPEATAATLAEMAGHAANAEKVFSQAREAQSDADQKIKLVKATQTTLDQRRAEIESYEQRTRAELNTREAGLRQSQDDYQKQLADLDARGRKLTEREALLVSAEKRLDQRDAGLQQREQALATREQVLADREAVIAPIVAKFRGV